MARNIDENKIIRIKEATMQMVVTNGFGNASISRIAKLAGVAEGYLYNYYRSKTELVEDLLYTNMNEIADKLDNLLAGNYSTPEVFEHLIRLLFEIANGQPERIKFLYVMMNDYNFKIQESQRLRILNLCRQVKINGNNKGDLKSDIDEEEIYLIGVTYPLQFINLRIKSFFDNSILGEKEIQKVLKICRSVIQN